MEYGPRGQPRQVFEGIVREDGIEVDGVVFSPSYAAVRCIQNAGSDRKTASGWTSWKTPDGQLIDDLYQALGSAESAEEEPKTPISLGESPA